MLCDAQYDKLDVELVVDRLRRWHGSNEAVPTLSSAAAE